MIHWRGRANTACRIVTVRDELTAIATQHSTPRSTPEPVPQTRDGGIDAFRFLMAMGVIVGHVLSLLPNPVGQPWGMPAWAVPIDAVLRSAVPFFFIVSGYFFRYDRGFARTVRYVGLRILPIYGLWMLVYFALGFLRPNPVPFRLLMLAEGGYGYHLWFLPALAFGLVTVSASVAIGGRRLAAAVVVLLALLGPILFDYHALVGIPEYSHHLSDLKRQLAAPAFVFIGYALRGTQPARLDASIALCVVSLATLLCERYFLAFVAVNPAVWNAESIVSTFLLGTSVFMLARSLNGCPVVARLQSWGFLTLPVYLCHLAYVWLFQRITPAVPARTLVIFVLVAICSVATAVILVRIPLIRTVAAAPGGRRDTRLTQGGQLLVQRWRKRWDSNPR
jgi:surface polysaccharide O-acyltransferase-like enzyme